MGTRLSVIVLGAAGFLGRAVVRLLARHEHLQPIPFTRADCDVSQTDKLRDAMSHHFAHAIINCAGIVDFKAPIEALYQTNVLAPAVCAEYAKLHNMIFIQAGSACVHGTRFNIASLDAPLVLDTAYGASKWMADQHIHAPYRWRDKTPMITVRFGGIYGVDGPDHLGLNKAISEARIGRPPRLVGSGRAKRNYIHVDDAAAALVHCCTHPAPGVYYAGGDETISINEMINTVCEELTPGQRPIVVDGPEAGDAIVAKSDFLPGTATMRSVLRSGIAR